MTASKQLFSDLIDQRREPVVRTTFTLTANAIMALDWLSDELDVQVKDVADLALCKKEHDAPDGDTDCVRDILALIQREGAGKQGFDQRKNLTLRKSSVAVLNELARQHGIARDVFVNHMILHARHCLGDVVAEREAGRREILGDVQGWIAEIEPLMQRVSERLGETDPCRRSIEGLLTGTRAAFTRLCDEYHENGSETDGQPGE